MLAQFNHRAWAAIVSVFSLTSASTRLTAYLSLSRVFPPSPHETQLIKRVPTLSATNSTKLPCPLPPAPQGGTIIFDLDGTLVDSVRDLLPALNYTIGKEGLDPISREQIGQVVGKGALKMVAQAYNLQGRNLDEPTQTRLLDVFLERYGSHTSDETVFFDGCLALLDRLQSEGWKLSVCTNKYAYLAEKLLVALNERDRFDALTGGDTFDFKKPDGRHISETVALAGGNIKHSVMVGDSISDIDGAKNAGIPVIAVDFGYTDVPVDQLNPDVVISHFNDFDTALANIAAARNW